MSIVPNLPPGEPTRRAKVLLAIGYFGILLAQASVAPLQEPDEGRYASIAWEMVSSGDWITPHLNGIRYYEKPPMFFWFAGGALAALGTSDLSVRIPSVVASFLTVLLVAHWGRRIRGPRTGLLGAAVLATMILFALLARAAIVDPLLTLAVAGALYCGDRFFLDRDSPNAAPGKWRLGFWGALAVAALVKGPVGVVLPLASVGVFALVIKDWRGLRSLLRPDGLALFLALTAPWYAAMSSRNPDYLAEFLLGQNLDRFVDGERFNRDKPFWFYLPVLLVGPLPWSFFLPRLATEVREAWSDRTLPASRRRLYLACAVAVPFLILSFAHSKLLHYVLPLCPPLALLLAETLSRRWKPRPHPARAASTGFVHFLVFGIAVLAFALVALALAAMTPESIAPRLGFEPGSHGHEVDVARIRKFQSPLRGTAAALGVMGVSALGAAAMARRGRPMTAVAVLAGAILGAVFGVQFLIAPMGPTISASALSSKAARYVTADTPVILYRRYLRGMTFYLKRPVLLWDALYNEFGHEVGG